MKLFKIDDGDIIVEEIERISNVKQDWDTITGTSIYYFIIYTKGRRGTKSVIFQERSLSEKNRNELIKLINDIDEKSYIKTETPDLSIEAIPLERIRMEN